ncbi:hypothetical protein ACJMK2_002648, partial [Sinanodonta woodiana]
FISTDIIFKSEYERQMIVRLLKNSPNLTAESEILDMTKRNRPQIWTESLIYIFNEAKSPNKIFSIYTEQNQKPINKIITINVRSGDMWTTNSSKVLFQSKSCDEIESVIEEFSTFYTNEIFD